MNIQKAHINELYYALKPCIPRRIQVLLRRTWVMSQISKYPDVWPIDARTFDSGVNPVAWPENKKFAFVLTHDVETKRGLGRSLALAEVEKERGFKSSFNFVPERYDVPETLRKDLADKGFEIGVHGLCHDGRLYASEDVFKQRAERINRYLDDWNAVGFRSPSMHHNLDWIGHLNIEYDSSTFDTDPFEPCPEGVRSIFPFWFESRDTKKGYIELPYTLPQDFTLFVLMKEKSPDIWKRKLDWIAQRGGMALVNVHPDYTSFDPQKCLVDEYPVKLYADFLDHVQSRYEGDYWNVLPREVASYSRHVLAGS